MNSDDVRFRLLKEGRDPYQTIVELENERRESRLAAIQGVMALIDRSGSYNGSDPDGLTTYSNGYGLYFIDANNPTTTRPLTAEEILERIEAREALAKQRGRE